MKNVEMPVNGAIRSATVRLVLDNGDQSVIPVREAQNMARDAGLDLVQFSTSNPPVVKIVDYGKLKFDLQKKAKEAAKKSRDARVELKELQFRPVTDDNDVQRIIKRANEFLAEGDKVRFVCKFRGRENAHRENGFAILNKILAEVNGATEGNISSQDRNISVIVSHNKA